MTFYHEKDHEVTNNLQRIQEDLSWLLTRDASHDEAKIQIEI